MANLAGHTAAVVDLLEIDEDIVRSVYGNFDNPTDASALSRLGAVFATDRRLIFYTTRLFTGRVVASSVPFADITDAAWAARDGKPEPSDPGERSAWHLQGKIRFQIGGRDVKVSIVDEGDPVAFVAHVRERIGLPPQRASSPVLVPEDPTPKKAEEEVAHAEPGDAEERTGPQGRGPFPEARPPESTRAPSDDDVVARLERLTALHRSGALTAEEFARAKDAVLDDV